MRSVPPSEPDEQMILAAWDCPTCLGTGRQLTADGLTRCRVCQGGGRVDFDPNDHSVIPY